ncbi:MAG: hypothetical protein CVU51_17725 [Deltaproteobacteria bacterium HGW-Deltaproteobacteria-1]|nr:MAG: hypothetical protein CVU51_17725 [Deltaproteobacteria bacterium HGW-Deltaproteobacteria-1]
MDDLLKKSFVAGVERVAAWADLLDAINVYPIADGDTGRNLSVSLSPLRYAGEPKEKLARRLLMAARGNSGNIASQFFSAFYDVDSPKNLKVAVQEGNARAWKAVSDPRLGTMLSVFDALEENLSQQDFIPDQKRTHQIMSSLEQAVHETQDLLPKLTEAGVVDAGALGMYIFFEGFFYTLAGGYCIDFVVKADGTPDDLAKISGGQESVVMIQEGDLYKIHMHTDDREKVKAQVSALGAVINWEDDNLSEQIREFRNTPADSALHIMTDAAGSLTREDARKYGFTLLSSYLTVGDKSLPETCFPPGELYSAMESGIKVSTSQASAFERHQSYVHAMARFEKVLYLCVGSAFTGNYSVAMEWKKEHDPDNRLMVVDTGAACGRLGFTTAGRREKSCFCQKPQRTD